ncbi:MAG: sugar ABC transporter substrate-binding protein [Planctomycetes bacterium]|nr:sugar ABC transporter substrate-binding protein [Planctomycetota bacterium]
MAILLWILLSADAKEHESGPVVLSYMVWGKENEIRELRAKLDEFELQNPGVKVKITNVTGPYQTKLATMLAGGIGPDVFMLHTAMFPALAERKLLLPLDGMAASDQDLKLDDFFPQIVECCRYKPRWSEKPLLYMLPTSFISTVVYYNRDQFDAAGVPYPDDNWTWEDFREKARRLTARDAKGAVARFGCWNVGAWLSFLCFMWQNGGECFDKNDMLVIGKPQYLDRNVEALQFCADLTFVDKVQPNVAMQESLPHNPFESGSTAMLLTGTWHTNQMKDFQAFRWAMAPLPGHGSRATIVIGGGPVINNQTKHPREAWLLLKFFTSDKEQKDILLNARGLPARMSVARQWRQYIRGFPPDCRMDVAFDSLQFARPQPCGRVVSPLLDIQIANEREKIMAGTTGRDGIREALVRLQQTYDTACPYCNPLK